MDASLNKGESWMGLHNALKSRFWECHHDVQFNCVQKHAIQLFTLFTLLPSTFIVFFCFYSYFLLNIFYTFLQLFFILACAEEEEIICPKNIKTFAFDSDSTKFYYCPEEGDYAVVKTCPGRGNYKSVIGDCVGGNEVENDENIKARNTVAKSRMMVAEKDVNQQNSKNKLEGDDRLKNQQAAAKDIHQQPSMGRHVTLGALYYGKENRIANDENFELKAVALEIEMLGF